MMLVTDTNNPGPYFNLAAEEYLFRELKQEIFLVYINSPSVIIGKHQNPAEEASTRCLRENNIPLVRRISGGGAVYHDEGNLNYTFIMNKPAGRPVNFSDYTKPVISFLNELGLDAYAGDKNEIRTGGLKISGNAGHVFKDRVLHHGTLLFSADLDLMSRCLDPAGTVTDSRAVQSNRTEVCNMQGLLPAISGIHELKNRFMDYILNSNDAGIYILNSRDIKNINKLKEQKFMSWDWNYAYGPDYIFSRKFHILNKEAYIKMKISKGIISECKFTAPGKWERLGQLLPGTRHNFDDIAGLITDNGFSSDSDLVYNFLM